MDECITGIPGCTFGNAEAMRGMNYAKQYEIVMKHLQWHLVMETRRMAEAMESLANALRGSQERPEPTVVPGSGERPIPRPTESVNGRCIRCGFPVLSRFHLDRCEEQDVFRKVS